jgi:hypothetical protein
LNSGGGVDLLGASRGGRNQTCPGGARIPSRETREVVAYFTQVTSPNLLVFTLMTLSLSLGVAPWCLVEQRPCPLEHLSGAASSEVMAM